KPPLYAGVAVVALMILTGLAFAGMAVVLAVMMPIFVVLSPILVPAVITSSVLATCFIASGSLGASGIALLVWLYKKEEHSTSTLHARGVRPEGLNKLAGGDKASDGDKPLMEDKPPEKDKPEEEDKPPQNDNSTGGEKPAGKDKPLGGVKHASIPEISKVMLVEQEPIVPKCCGTRTSTKRSHQFRFAMDTTKARSVFMKEYQKVPRVGAFAYKYFTSRDKKYVNHIHI
ncbi:hypothetical protein CARUB_v10028444mg, partial [Capsella rubella]